MEKDGELLLKAIEALKSIKDETFFENVKATTVETSNGTHLTIEVDFTI